jgi:hypothetical protein
MRGYFTAEIVVDFDKSDDDGTAARDALNEYIDSHDVSEAFELDKIEDEDSPRMKCADELVAAGWPVVASDIREGMSSETVIRRLAAIGEYHSEAAGIVAKYDLPNE